MNSFAERVQALTGLDISGDEILQGYFDSWINDSIVELSNVLPSGVADWMSQNQVLTDGEGLTLDRMKVISVVRTFNGVDYPCKSQDANMRGRLQESGGMFEANVYEPFFYRKGGKVYILPEPNADEKGNIEYIQPPTGTWNLSSIDGFPDDLEPVLVYAIALKAVVHLFTVDEDEELYPPLYTILKQDYTNALSGVLTSFGVSPPSQPSPSQGQGGQR